MGNISWFQFGVFILLITAIYYTLFYYHYYIRGKGGPKSIGTGNLKPNIHQGHDILGAVSPLIGQQKTNSQPIEKKAFEQILQEKQVIAPLPSQNNKLNPEVSKDLEDSYLEDFDANPETVEISNTIIPLDDMSFDEGLELDMLMEGLQIPENELSDEDALSRAEKIDALMERDSFVSELVKKSQVMSDYLQVNYYRSNEQEKWIELPNLKGLLGLEKEELQESESMDF